MIKIKALSKELVDGYPDGGAHFYWEPGSRIVLVQEWEHMAAGPVWGQVMPDPMVKDDLAKYINTFWDNYIIVEVEEDHC